MSTLLWIVLFGTIGGLGAILISSLFLLFHERLQKFLVPALVSYATGTLLASALLGLVHHALEEVEAHDVLQLLLFGILGFFMLEKVVLWRHCHKHDCKVHDASAQMIIVGDAFHNFVDGVAIAAAFMTSVPVGIAVSLSVILHEIPQELGDFAILLHNGFSKGKALFWNALSSLASLLGALLAYFSLSKIENAVPYAMTLAAASFIYIALVDLSPGLHKKTGFKSGMLQIILILAGVATVFLTLHEH